ncbi:hypothetical protein P175DRAFT_0246930 [Aspergillus ochraceoroseus IBT 24754]|uniref:Uncharacterized protein n=2 Tax=Aspergillus ochraceoroseus TaxID=138278 RepID=A0A2T5LXV5_9EURO|nr:uncharacterized protein P175DRAFT_0246930 [Aspergillus ochraceoroseus IBT 24754]KKK24793.1 hypothetical protein AOCH_007763 [Aspergillus ochraceoroseus]PTU21117.1 hypothetical protein P175DRAFT_0246930 [Aspergillus ochraceoroseus IBT 24754]
MYDTAVPLDLSYMNQASLPRHYESDEEEISESETWGQEHTFSPIDSFKLAGTLDFNMITDERSSVNLGESGIERPVVPRLLSPFPSTGKPSRPVSMDTVKRSSCATFVTDSYIFDNDDDMIIELPSPNSTTPLQSPLFLQPTVYVPSEPFTSPINSSSRSSSPSSFYSDNESDIFIAEQVTYVEPTAKPNLILISPVSEQSSPREDTIPQPSLGSFYSLDQAAKSQPLLGETSMNRGRSRYSARPMRGPFQMSLSGLETAGYALSPKDISEPASATAAEMAQSMSLRHRSMTFSRPQTSFAESGPFLGMRSRLQKDQSCRPPSAQSAATFSLFPSTHPFPFARDDHRSRSISYSHSAASSEYSLSSQTSQPVSRTPSPTPYYSNPFHRSRSGSIYSVSSVPAAHAPRPPLPYRGSLIKGSSSLSGYSASSLRSEIENSSAVDPQQRAETEFKSKSRRKKSLKQIRTSHSKAENSDSSTTKSFVDFMLRGKRKSTIKNF